jgi:hypothetical protein
VNLSGKRREDVPDILLFANAEARSAALAETRDNKRYHHGLAILEAKRWLRPLDRGDSQEPTDPGAPSSQMLRYLSRADVTSDRAVKWGLLTNGGTWRLYWQDARSRAEEFFELDLAALLGLPGVQHAEPGFEPAHGLRLFFLLFNRAAFLAQVWDAEGRSFHAYARNEARVYEERVSQDLGQRVFDEVFPALAQALAAGDLQAAREKVGYGQFTRQRYTAAYLEEVREATLIFLYRLLFLFYAEDRRLLPVDDPRYRAYSVRALRERVRDSVQAGKALATRLTNMWFELRSTFQLISDGEDSIGMPAYNGGLFSRSRSLLLERTSVPDATLAPLIDALSRRTEDDFQGWINYRDLSVSHLGSIYERLLEYSLVHEVQAADDYRDKPEINRVVARPASFARKVSGSYYTHDDLVRLVLRESVGLLASERVAAFEQLVTGWKRKASLTPPEWDRLDAADPASTLLELKVCDPAMGSGHFLVALVDFMADRVLEAATTAQLLVAAQPWAAHLVERGRPWESPLLTRMAHVRSSIKRQAQEHGWAVSDTQLDDRHIVRRMVLKKCIFGADKNLMAVELAKTALWLHTFTVGAPLSFLDHHLKHGDSLHGERLPAVQQDLQALGMLFQQAELQRLEQAAKNLQQVADYTDVDIAEVRASKALAEEAELQVAPVHALLNFWRAMRWLQPLWPPTHPDKLARVADEAQRTALAELFSHQRNLVAVLSAGQLEGSGAAVAAARELLARTQALSQQEKFLHWWTAFPTAFSGRDPGFDAVIGNPPWDRIKLQEVEWFAERDLHIAAQPRAADRKALIADLQKKQAPLARDYAAAVARAEAQARVLSKGGDFPLLGGGDVNLYALFVERAQALIKPSGLVALITPSGIAADKGAAEFFKSIATTGRLGALFDFENRKTFFADVHASFKFCALVFGGSARQFEQSRCAFFLRSLKEVDEGSRTLKLTADNFALVNPNTGAAPIFRTQRDADICMRMYSAHPVLCRKAALSDTLGRRPDEKAWPVRYARMFDMTNDSGLFLKPSELKTRGFGPSALGRYQKELLHALPLYEGKMVQAFDHRAADVTLNLANLKRAAQQEAIPTLDKQQPDRYPMPQYWVLQDDIPKQLRRPYFLAYKSVTAPSNMRTMIASLLPECAVGNSMAMLVPEVGEGLAYARWAALLLANLNALAYDFVLRQKLQGQNLNWFIVEQSCVVKAQAFDGTLPTAFAAAMREAGLMNGHHAQPTVADFVVPQVLALSYTAHDLAPFARDLGYVNDAGDVLPPFAWNDEERRARTAALDALFFYLYGLGEDDAAYVLDTFPIVRQQDQAAFGRYRTQDEVLTWLRLLPQAVPPQRR